MVFFIFLALQHFTVFYSTLHVGGFDEPLSFGQIFLAISASRYHSHIKRGEVTYVFESIKKRDGRVVDFDSSKITAAIAKAGNATAEFEEKEARKLTLRVLTLAHELKLDPAPEVEEIQDIVDQLQQLPAIALDDAQMFGIFLGIPAYAARQHQL